jgi:glycine cleavage system H protein
MSQVLADLRYAKSHEWARSLPDGRIEVGITDHAQHALGDLVFVDVPQVGTALEVGGACAVVESVKAASDVYSPVAGTVVEVNESLSSSPELINEDCYGKGWLYRVQPAAVSGVDVLLDASAYSAVLAAEGG